MFLYYVSGAATDGVPEEFKHAFGDVKKPSNNDVNRGPDGGRGRIFFPNYYDNLSLVRYSPDKQKWRQVGDRYWIGLQLHDWDSTTLLRQDAVEGELVELGDGREWRVPVARFFPRTRRWEDGTWKVGDVQAKYSEPWEVAQSFWELLESSKEDEDATITVEHSATWCSTLLKTNYRIAEHEIDMLELLTDDTETQMLYACIDLQGMVDRIKKNEPLT